MKTAIRLSIIALLFALCAINHASAQTVSGSGVVYSAAAPMTGVFTQEQLTANAATFSANASMSAGKANGTMVVDFATTTFSGFVTNVTVSTPNSKGMIVTTVTSEGYLTVNATKAQTIVKSTAIFVNAPGSKGAMALTFNNYATGAAISNGSYNILTGGVGVAQ